MKRGGRLRRKTPLRPTPLREHLMRAMLRVEPAKGMPDFLKAVPKARGHGSNSYEKRLWRIISDYVRIRDWYKFKECAATGAHIASWQMGDAGHFKSYTDCNGMFKFDPMNIHLQSKRSNAWGSQEIGHQFGETLKRRYGPKYLDLIERENRAHHIEQRSREKVLKMAGHYLLEMHKLREQPAYCARAVELLEGWPDYYTYP